MKLLIIMGKIIRILMIFLLVIALIPFTALLFITMLCREQSRENINTWERNYKDIMEQKAGSQN